MLGKIDIKGENVEFYQERFGKEKESYNANPETDNFNRKVKNH